MNNTNQRKGYTYPLLVITKSITKLNNAIGKFLACTTVVLTFLILMEVLLRYVFKSPTIWGFDVSLWLFGMPAILGGGYVHAQKGHVTMDLVYSKVSPRVQAILDSITSTLFFAFSGVLLWQGIRFAKSAYINQEISITTWQILIWPLKICIPIAAVLLFLQGIVKLIIDLHMAITGRELA